MANFKPEGWPTVIPRIIVAKPQQLVNFLKDVFSAQGEFHAHRPAEMRIGDSLIMISSGDGVRQYAPAFLYVYVENVDDVYGCAIKAGAESLVSRCTENADRHPRIFNTFPRFDYSSTSL